MVDDVTERVSCRAGHSQAVDDNMVSAFGYRRQKL